MKSAIIMGSNANLSDSKEPPVQRNVQEVFGAFLSFTTVGSSGNEIMNEEMGERERFFVFREMTSLGQIGSFVTEGAKVEISASERSLLSYILAVIQRMDPDVIVGHNITGFDLPLLVSRLKALKIERWSRVGRLSLAAWPNGPRESFKKTEEDEEEVMASTMPTWTYSERACFSGRLICDTYLGAKENVKAKNYSLNELAQMFLATSEKEDMSNHPIRSIGLDWTVSAKEIYFLLNMISDRSLSLALHLCLLQLSRQLTILAGNIWSHTLLGGARAERNEFLLLHEFHAAKFIVPDKERQQPSGKRRKLPSYSGGLVLEPKAGLYETHVLLLDFNSLYPSIIQEFNICFTTVERGTSQVLPGQDATLIATDDYNKIGLENQQLNNICGPGISGINPKTLPNSSDPTSTLIHDTTIGTIAGQTSSTMQGILPRILARLVARRRAVKKLLGSLPPGASQGERSSLQIRQQALKLTANSMYGCLGYIGSRFYARPIAELITAQGRALLTESVELVLKEGFQVIYGDTDSIMVDTGSYSLQESRRVGALIKKAINERHKLIEIDLEAIFARLLLLKKKKYAALLITNVSEIEMQPENPFPKNQQGSGDITRFTTRLETKGLDMVRRDWCKISVDISK